MKAGTATKLVLNTITTGAMVLLGKVRGNLMVDLQVTCAKLRDRAERILMETLEISRAGASQLLDEAGGHLKSALVMGERGVDLPTARRLLMESHGRVADAGDESPT
jgi:N-acetylmuramic acid 6-phosphate etherase